MIAVKSSLMSGVEYNSSTQILKVQFKNGDIWLYERVDDTIYSMLMEATSIGKFFLENIKGKYTSTKEEK